MQLIEDTGFGKYLIRAYDSEFIQVNETKYEHSIIVSENHLIPWEPQSLAELKITHLQPILDLKPTIVLLGSGSKLIFPTDNLLTIFREKHIGIEVMDTGAACRTFDVLIAEGRNVVAALLLR